MGSWGQQECVHSRRDSTGLGWVFAPAQVEMTAGASRGWSNTSRWQRAARANGFLKHPLAVAVVSRARAELRNVSSAGLPRAEPNLQHYCF